MSDCHSLWQELRQLSRKMGDCFYYIYGTVIVVWFAALTVSLYGELIGILNHGIHLKGITVLGNALLYTINHHHNSSRGQLPQPPYAAVHHDTSFRIVNSNPKTH